MTSSSPILFPPPELVERLCKNVIAFSTAMPPLTTKKIAVWLIEEAYVAGANQELDACCAEVSFYEGNNLQVKLRTARRPKPPTLKEQALADLHSMSIEPCLINGIDVNASVRAKYNNIRRAIEALPND
jgi:hypothetical protein